MSILLFFVAICITSGHTSDPKFINSECRPRSFGSDSIVCVCNGNHCDKVHRVRRPARGTIVQITSSMEGLRFARTSVKFDDVSPSSGPRIEVQRTKKFQEIIGFGGAFTDSATMNIKSLPEDAQEQLLRSYFSGDGIEYNIGRVPIAGCDFSTRAYSYADNPGNETMLLFELVEEDFLFKIPVIKQALNVMPGPDKMLLTATAWSAPPWMKTNNRFDGSGFLKKKYYQVYADYHVFFLDAYAEYGLKFWSVSTGNEPTLALFPVLPINSLAWSPGQLSLWIRENLGPTLRRSQHNQTKILALDDQAPLLHFLSTLILGNEETHNYVDGFAVHWYFDYFIKPTSVLEKTHQRYPSKFIIYTEASVGVRNKIKVILGSWQRAELIAEDMISVLNHWVTGWVDWNLALDTIGGPNYINNFVDSPVIVNSSAGEFYKQPTFYIQGHFSKFFSRGSVRISAEVDRSCRSSPFISILRKTFRMADETRIPLTVAFERPDGVIALIVMNTFNERMTVELVDDQSGKAVLDLPKRSISTLLYV